MTNDLHTFWGLRLKHLPLSSVENRIAIRNADRALATEGMRGTAFDLYRAPASYACVRVREEARKKTSREEDMRRQKYGSANLKYVKVERG